MKFRFHRGSLADSMDTCVTISATRKAIADHCNRESELGAVSELEIQVRHYRSRDDRIGWAPVYVVSGRHGVIGFCDESVNK